jgi:hypothetical protein
MKIYRKGFTAEMRFCNIDPGASVCSVEAYFSCDKVSLLVELRKISALILLTLRLPLPLLHTELCKQLLKLTKHGGGPFYETTFQAAVCRVQGCQMVYFQTKPPDLVTFGIPLNGKFTYLL